MEVSNEIKEEIRRTQSDLKNAIRVHQMWVVRLQEDESNDLYKRKVAEAEKDIIAVSKIQKRVVERLRRELELYQRRLTLGNGQVNAESDIRHVAQQLRDHQLQHRNQSRDSLLKPSVLTQILRSENGDTKPPSDASDSESKLSNEASLPSDGKENGTGGEDGADKFSENAVGNRRTNFTRVLNKVKQSFRDGKLNTVIESWQAGSEVGERSDSDSSPAEPLASPSPSPPPLPHCPHAVSQETFLRFLGLVTPRQKEVMEKKRSERRKRCTTSTNRNEFVYDNFDMQPKRKKYNQFPYLQTCTPPQTRSQRLRRPRPALARSPAPDAPSEPTHSSTSWHRGDGDPAWLGAAPPPLRDPAPRPQHDENTACAGCGRNDVVSLLVWCSACRVRLHTGCAAHGKCPRCQAALPEPAGSTPPAHAYRDGVAQRARLRQRNVELCADLRKLETRAAGLKESLALHNEEKRELLAKQIQTQRNLQKLLDVMSRFKDTAVGSMSNSASGSDVSSDLSKTDD